MLIIFNCNSDLPKEPITDDPLAQVSLEKKTAKEYWFSDYLTLNPYLYGIKTYNMTFGGTGQFTSEVIGTEIIPYQSGDIIGTRVSLREGSRVFYSDNRYFYLFLKNNNKIVSTDCDMSAYPPGYIFGKIFDGQILSVSGPAYSVDADLLSCIEEIPDFDWALIKIEDVFVNGKRYNNALILWHLNPSIPFVKLNFYGKENDLGLTLPTSIETNGQAITSLNILGRKMGIIANADFHSSSGELQDIYELISTTRH
jgi:hypothetical protein